MRSATIIISTALLCLGNLCFAQDRGLEIRIDAYLTESTARGFSGAILVAQDGEIVLSKGYGLADREKDITINPDTVFDIGSVTKPFTASAIMLLAQKGKLRTTDTLQSYFPEIPTEKAQITIHQVLTHSAGFRETVGRDYDPVGRREFLNKLFESDLLFTPGSKYSYSNAGYSLLAAIVEIVSGMQFEQFLNNELFLPAGMNQTGYTLPQWGPESFANSYFFDLESGGWSKWGTTLEHFPPEGISWNLIGNGALHSTIEDLYRWHLALTQGKILSHDTQQLMESRHIEMQENGSNHYGYGWAIFTSARGTDIVNHNGSNGFFYADYLDYTDENVLVITLSNLARNPGAARNIANLVFDPNFQPPDFSRDELEVVYQFVAGSEPSDVQTFPAYFEQEQGYALNNEAVLNRAGLQFMRSGKHEWAVALLALNVKTFPNNGNLWDSLGEAYLASGLRERAIESFEQALALSPGDDCNWCDHAREQLEDLAN
jgi:CubicO group peptidase (beta-lactamase class C family)